MLFRKTVIVIGHVSVNFHIAHFIFINVELAIFILMLSFKNKVGFSLKVKLKKFFSIAFTKYKTGKLR